MFITLFKYRLKRLLNDKAELFWLAIFPLVLGTFFYMAFSGISEKSESLNKIKVAVVNEGGYAAEASFLMFIDAISGEDGIIETVKANEISKAEELMNDNEIEGIILLTDKITVKFAKEGINQTILKNLINRYLHSETIIMEQLSNGAGDVIKTAKALFDTKNINKELSISSGKIDPYSQYFFALMAMCCMFGSTYGLINTREIQADLSKVAIRRNISPSKKSLLVITDFLAAFTIIFVVFIILYLYLTNILKVDFGKKIGLILLAGAVSGLNGISLGYMIGVLIKAKESVKEAITTAIVLILNFFAGLMVGGMKYIIEKNVPLFNHINPAALISDCFLSISVFEDMNKYYTCILILVIQAAIFGIVSITVLRRKKYADL